MIMTKGKEGVVTSNRLPGSVDMLPANGAYTVQCSSDPAELAVHLEHSEADFVVVGAVLPARSGTELCRLLRDERGNMQYPVLLLRAADSRDVGARRVVAGMRPTSSERTEGVNPPDAIQLNDLQIHPGRHEVTVKGEVIDLTATEFRLLRIFTEQPGWVFSRDQIIEAIRGKGYACTPRSVDVLIVGLRRKLGKLGPRIQTIRGVGYRYRE